jgi:hypothetical protein
LSRSPASDPVKRRSRPAAIRGADVAGVEFGQPLGEPVVAVSGEQPGGQVRKFVHVLAGVEQIDDLGGLGEMLGGEVPEPHRAVAQDGELADVPGAAAAGLGGH